MTDGPFRNASLSNSWKQYGWDLVSEAVSPEYRVKQACHSMLGDIDFTHRDALSRTLRDGRMRISPDRLEDVLALIRLERSRECTCLPGYRSRFQRPKQHVNLELNPTATQEAS